MSRTIARFPADLRLPVVASGGGRMRLDSQRDHDHAENHNDDNKARCPTRAPCDCAFHMSERTPQPPRSNESEPTDLNNISAGQTHRTPVSANHS